MRFVVRIATIAGAACADELWLGIVTDGPAPELPDLGELIPADDMTAAELSLVREWIDLRC